MTLLSRIFGTETFKLPTFLDMHSHILPGIDDGAKTLEESIGLIHGLKSLGFNHLIATPHIMGDYYKNDKDTIELAYNSLIRELETQQIEIEISFAAEYYLDEWFTELLNKKEQFLCLKDKTILIETSYINQPNNFRETIFELQMQGYDIVLAHPERYTYLYHNFDKVEELVENGVKLQLNLNSLMGHYGPIAQKYAQRMIEKKLVHYVGSDCHHERHIEMLNTLSKNKYFGKLSEINLLNDTLLV